MKIKKVLEHNSQSFLEDLNRATQFLAYVEKTDDYYAITKKSLIDSAQAKHIEYFMSENLGNIGATMIIL